MSTEENLDNDEPTTDESDEESEAALELKYEKVARCKTVNWLHMMCVHHKY